MSSYGVSTLWFRWPLGLPDQIGDPDVFPFLPGQGFFVEKTPVWKTQLVRTASGRSRKSAMWSAPMWKFSFNYEALIEDGETRFDLSTLFAFFQSQQGQTGVWKYWDRYDNSVVNQKIGIGDGATTAFQLVRSWGQAGLQSVEPIYAPLGLPKVFVNNVATPVSLGANGTVIFSSAPASGALIAWTGAFFYLCEFEADSIAPSQPYWNIWALDKLGFQSVKPDRVIA